VVLMGPDAWPDGAGCLSNIRRVQTRRRWCRSSCWVVADDEAVALEAVALKERRITS